MCKGLGCVELLGYLGSIFGRVVERHGPVCPSSFQSISRCGLEPFPSVLEMGWAVLPIQASRPHVLGILAERLQAAPHPSKLFNTLDTSRSQVCSNKKTGRLDYQKSKFEIRKVLPVLFGRGRKGPLQAVLKGSTGRFCISHLLLHCSQNHQELKASLEVALSCVHLK
jgi:hypothetical protein